ncbi:spore coat protein YsxE [Litchfieldia salsa]|uniref:Spore coat protein YsxE n=1 Tax=Litchfieldia salsa TaxID=930152 RepID=A0A1H0NUS2_9BACI|nr:spore coat protein YsxE [Litchfieldia salsa]SDO96507.1 spore coat protein YsxE [Litchfieldia salsa]
MAVITKIDYGPILQRYNLTVNYIEEKSRNVVKIYTQKGVFALKSIENVQDLSFIHHIGEAYNKGFTRFIPFYKTMDGEFVVNQHNKYYYLMPWLKNEPPDERSSAYQQLFKMLGRFHTVTSEELTYNEEDVTQHYKAVKEKWEKRMEYLEGYIDRCENKLYMSPFELQFTTYFNEMMQASQFAKARLEEWYGQIKGVKKFRTSLTHGKVSINHLLYDDQDRAYFTSLEKVRKASPVNDIVSFFYRTLRTYPIQSEECVGYYNEYNEHHPLAEEEVQLLLSYLTFPEPMYRAVINYVDAKNSKMSEQQSVANLVRTYWLNKNIEFVASQILMQEQQKKDQKLAEELEEETLE